MWHCDKITIWYRKWSIHFHDSDGLYLRVPHEEIIDIVEQTLKWITHGHLAPHKDPKYLPSFPPPISNIPCLLGALCYLDRENGHSKLRDSLRIWYRSLLGLLGRHHNGCLLNCPKFCVPRFFYNDDNLVMFTLFFLPFSPKIIFARILNKEHIAAVKRA